MWTKSATMSLQYQRSDEPHARRAGAGSDMSNVVRFKKPTPIQPHASAGRHEVIASIAALPARISEIRNVQAQLKEDVRITILMLDLAVAHGRLLANATDDPGQTRNGGEAGIDPGLARNRQAKGEHALAPCGRRSPRGEGDIPASLPRPRRAPYRQPAPRSVGRDAMSRGRGSAA